MDISLGRWLRVDYDSKAALSPPWVPTWQARISAASIRIRDLPFSKISMPIGSTLKGRVHFTHSRNSCSRFPREPLVNDVLPQTGQGHFFGQIRLNICGAVIIAPEHRGG
jgi:hypothetical protein